MPPEHASASATALRLAPGEQVVLSGCARVSVTRGELWVHGHVVGPGQHAVLRSCAEVGSLLVLEATQRSALRATLSALERSPGAPLPPSEMLPGPYRVPRQSAYGFEVAPAGGQGTVLPPSWRAACDGLVSAINRGEKVTAVVCGSKGVGKSTLVRLAVNTLLQHVPTVGLLDVDPGQAELTPPGLVSLTRLTVPLLGPPAIRLGCSEAPQPVEQRFIGDVSPKADPVAYAAAVNSLLAAWRSTHSSRAGGVLIVNTMGWVRGLGLELLCSLLRCCEPTHVLSLASEQERGVPSGVFWTLPGEPVPQCERIDLMAAAPGPQQPVALADPTNGDVEAERGARLDNPAQLGTLAQVKLRTSAELRGLLWAAWCHRATAAESDALADTVWADAWAPRTGGGSTATALVAESLTSAPPYCVHGSLLRIVALLSSLASGEVWHALNGAIVGLGVQQPDDMVPHCLGLALIRSVDPAAGTLYVLTPVPVGLAATADSLLLGKLELPLGLLLASPHSSPYLAMNALSGAEATGAGAMRSRNNLLRHGHGDA